LLSALLYFLAFSRPPVAVGSADGSIVMPVSSSQTLFSAGAGAAAPAGAAASVTPVAEAAATLRTRTNLRIAGLPARGRAEPDGIGSEMPE